MRGKYIKGRGKNQRKKQKNKAVEAKNNPSPLLCLNPQIIIPPL